MPTVRPQLICEIDISRNRGQVSGSIHSILRNESGAIYYTDEFSHSLVAIEPGGTVLWNRSGQGSGEGEFRYPRGLSFGRIELNREIVDCLAVADAWNQRIQFFDAEGNYLLSWTRAGAWRFSNPSDIRFIARAESGDQAPGYWVVLDSGNHRLCMLSVSGSCHSELGNAFPPGMESRWESTLSAGILSDLAEGNDISASRCFTPLFYPSRLVGLSEQGLFIWEAGARRLKHVYLGNLFPLSGTSGQPSKTTLAGSGGLFSQDLCTGVAEHFNPELLRWRRIEPLDKVVVEEVAGNGIWIRDGGKLQFWQLTPETSRQVEEVRASAPVLSGDESPGNLAGMVEKLVFDPAILQFLNRCGSLGSLAAEIRLLQRTAIPIPELQGAIRHAAVEFQTSITHQRKQFGEALSQQPLSLLKLSLTAQAVELSSGFAIRPRDADTPIGPWSVMSNAFRCLQAIQDEVNTLRFGIPQDEGSGESWRGILDEVCRFENEVQSVIRELQGLYCLLERLLLTLPDLDQPFAKRHLEKIQARPRRPRDGWLRFPERPRTGRSSKHLREIARMTLDLHPDSIPSSPYGICETSDGHRFVAMFEAHKVVHLDEQGRVVGSFDAAESMDGKLAGPIGIASDAEDRMWVTEFAGARVRVFDRNGKDLGRRITSGPDGIDLNHPIGICRASDGSMLVADSHNHRILHILPEEVRILAGGKGTDPGAFRFPVALSLSRGVLPQCIWVVDQRNHRIQLLDSHGSFVREVGGCGLGAGSLVLPSAVGVFDDGVLAVSHIEFRRTVKLFSPLGEELDCLLPDYSPGGVWTRGPLLLVTEWGGSGIRVYERRQSG